MPDQPARGPRYAGAIIVAVAGLLLLGAATVGVLILPTNRPAASTADVLADLDAHRLARSTAEAEPSPPSVNAELIPTPTPVPIFSAPIARFKVGKIGVDAPVSTKNLLADGTMESPDGPTDVSWYDFTAKPGTLGNAVFSGHVDYIRYGPAVFYNLRKLAKGDSVDVVLKDGTVLSYEVTATQSYPVELVPMREVLAQTAEDTLTIITCTGSFAAGDYSDRLIVRAVRTGVTPGSQ